MSGNSQASLVAYNIVIPVVLLAASAGTYFGLGQRPEAGAVGPRDEGPPLVETSVVGAHSGGFDLETDGVVVPAREVTLSAEVAGRIVLKSEVCKAGRLIERNALLYQLDKRDYQLEVDRLKRERNQADAHLQELDVEHKNTDALLKLAEDDLALQQREFRRLEGLRDKGAVTDSELDRARRSEVVARNAVQAQRNQQLALQTRRTRLEEGQALAQTALDKAELDLKRTEIRAPLGGMVVRDLVEQDAWAQKGAPLVTVEDTASVEVRCSLRVEELDWLWRTAENLPPSSGNEAPPIPPVDRATRQQAGYEPPPVAATITFQVGERQFAWDGYLARYDGIGLDEKTRTVPCRVVVPNPRKARNLATNKLADLKESAAPPLVRGMYVGIRFSIRPSDVLLVVPAVALRQLAAGESASSEHTGSSVWRLREGRLSIQPVHVIRAIDDRVLIVGEKGQLASGDKVVVSPLAAVHEGMAVREAEGKKPLAAK